MKNVTIVLALAAACGLAGALRASQTDFGSASVAAPWATVPNSPRDTAMGGALVADPEGLEALDANPAGLARMEGQQASLAHNAWFQNMALETARYGAALPSDGGLGLGLNYFNFGSVDTYTVDPNTGMPVAGGTVNPYGIEAQAGYGQRVGSLSLGASLKYLSQDLDGYTASAWGGDLGAVWETGFSGLNLGLAVQNLGSQLGGYALPLQAQVGAAEQVAVRGSDQATLALSGTFPSADSQADGVGVGGEYLFSRALALRLGYKYEGNAQQGGSAGLSAGLGLHWRWAEVDYAFQSLGDLGNSNQIGLGAKF